MTRPLFFILLLLFLFGNTACSQEEKRVIIDILKEKNKILEFKKDVNPYFSKKISENKNCSHKIYKDELYLTSIADEYKDGKYKSDFFLRKMDLEGNEKWVYIIDKFIKVAYKDILPTNDGVYILYEGYTGDLIRDCYLKKLDHQGKELWTKNLGKNHGTPSLDIIKLDADAHILFAVKGYETSTLYRISSSGKILNKMSFSDKSELTISDFDFDHDGNIYIIGQITSYPERKYMQEIFFYKLDPQFNLLQKKVQLFGRTSIADDIVFLENGKFAVKISSDTDYNRKPIETQIRPLFFLMDMNLNISNISQISSTYGSYTSTFKFVSENKIIALNKTYLNKNTYYVFHIFDGDMNFQKSTLIDFNFGIGDISILSDDKILANHPREEIFSFKISFD